MNVYEGNSIIAQEIPELLEKTKASIIELTGEIRMVAFKAVNVKAVDLLLEPQKDPKTKMQSTPRETPMEILGSRPGFYYNCFLCQNDLWSRDRRRNPIEWPQRKVSSIRIMDQLENWVNLVNMKTRIHLITYKISMTLP